jgi:hypothetical protein
MNQDSGSYTVIPNYRLLTLTREEAQQMAEVVYRNTASWKA